MRRWRYRTDVYVDGVRRFFDKPHWKHQQFKSGSTENPKTRLSRYRIHFRRRSSQSLTKHEPIGNCYYDEVGTRDPRARELRYARCDGVTTAELQYYLQGTVVPRVLMTSS